MVGTAQAADFAIFMRKIGYSVGLENVLVRAAEFGRAYASKESFRAADWVRLVRNVWNLKTDNVGDFFSALGIVRIVNREPILGPIGEALGILAQRVNEEEYQRAVKFLLLLTLVSHDGDVFLNALASGFKRKEFNSLLLQAIRTKRELLFGIFHNYQEQEAVFHAVAIDRQRSNRGSAGGKTLDALAKGLPLNARSTGLGLPQKLELTHLEEPSEDYLDKVLVTRRGWAEDLDLFQDGALTDHALSLLSTLRDHSFGTGAGSFLVWPTFFEIAKARFDRGTFSSIPLQSTLGQMRTLMDAHRKGEAFSPQPSPTGESLVQYVAGIYAAYRSLSQNRSMIRNELPLEVLGATWFAECCAERMYISLQSCQLSDPNLLSQGIVARTSQTIELALTVKRREGITAH
jgi:hypothetical protein